MEKCTNCHAPLLGGPVHFFLYAFKKVEQKDDEPVPVFCGERCMKHWVSYRTGLPLAFVYIDYGMYLEMHARTQRELERLGSRRRSSIR